MRNQHENKMHGEVEVKEEAPIDAATCPERWQHRHRLGQVCDGCHELIPALVAYTPEQMQRFFPGAALVEQPHAFPYTEEEAAVMCRYEVVCQQLNDAAFAVEEAQRRRRQSQTGHGPDRQHRVHRGRA